MTRRVIAAPPVLPGYTSVRPLGSGGFADVYLYSQDLPRRVVAAKVLTTEVVTPQVLRTFNAEADILAKLSAHPAVVTIHQASISGDGRPYLIMEYCPGTMSERYRRAPLPVTEVLDIGVRIGGALETAHRAGVLHRDIKPSNILVTTLGAPVLADFGIAAALAADSGEGLIAMSVPWSSPEVLQEQVGGSVPSEVWSLAATLYTLLVGRSPFESLRRDQNSRDQITGRIVKAKYTATARPDVPPRLEQALESAMSKDPRRRFPTVHAFAEELRWVQYELGVPPTALEVAAPEWVRSAGPVDLDDEAWRAPVASRVSDTSRRATRAAKADSDARRDRDGLIIRERRGPGPLVAALIGAAVAVVVIVGVGVTLLMAGVL